MVEQSSAPSATHPHPSAPPPTTLIPVSQWQARGHCYPATDAAWRHLIFHAGTNGLDEYGVIVRIGRRVLIDEAAFLRWAREHGGRK